MQQRLACARLYLSWNRNHGRALESLACSLKRRLFGTDNVYPLVKWDICALSCGGTDTLEFDLDFMVDEVDVLKLDDIYGSKDAIFENESRRWG